MSASMLAKVLHVPANRINGIVNEKRGITADTALRLSRYFQTSAELWLNLQKIYELRLAEVEVGAKIRREVKFLPALQSCRRGTETSTGAPPRSTVTTWPGEAGSLVCRR
jgi:addiction module HigA family antidote